MINFYPLDYRKTPFSLVRGDRRKNGADVYRREGEEQMPSDEFQLTLMQSQDDAPPTKFEEIEAMVKQVEKHGGTDTHKRE